MVESVYLQISAVLVLAFVILNGTAVGEEYLEIPEYPVTGSVTYETPEGIMLIRLGHAGARLLAAHGRYPRWSTDGKQIVFIRDEGIFVMDRDGGKLRRIAATPRGRAACFFPDGKSVLFIDGKQILRVQLQTGLIEKLLSGKRFQELDIADDGKRLVTTVKSFLGGYRVLAVDLRSGKIRTVGRGCSASISPDGRLVTVNGRKHRKLHLFSWKTLEPSGMISAPGDFRFDNQFWSNNRDWVVSKTQGQFENIFLHNLPSDKSFQVTFSGQCDRPDFYLEQAKLLKENYLNQ